MSEAVSICSEKSHKIYASSWRWVVVAETSKSVYALNSVVVTVIV